MDEKRSGAVLGNNAILKEIEKGKIIVQPFVRENLQTTSVDVRLGKFYYRQPKVIVSSPHAIVSINTLHVVNTQTTITKHHGIKIYTGVKMWNETWFEAGTLEEVMQDITNPTMNDSVFLLSDSPKMPEKDRRFILLNPGESILAHTEEFIGTSSDSDFTAMLQTKSTLGRLLIETCKCAGWGDKGYFNRWTLEITNNGKYAVLLEAGQRVAQMVFLRVEGCDSETTYTKKGHYQQGDNVEVLQKTWRPEMMLPKISSREQVQ